MEEKKKLSTAEILARARAQKAAAGEASDSGAAAAPEAAPPPAAQAASAPVAAPSGDAPKSTKDILAAARAQAAAQAASAEQPAAAEAPAAKPEASKPAAGGGPKNTKDILAAARAAAAAKAGGTAAPAGAAPAAASKAAKPAAPAGATPSVQEMLKAVRDGKAAEPASTEKAVVAPKIPQKSAFAPKAAPKAAAKPEAAPRRNFLLAILSAPFVLAWTLLTFTGLAAILGAARFMFPNVIVEPPSQFKIGPPGDYPSGMVSTKWTAQFGVWIVHADYQGKNLIYALSTVCTHLGCTPSWLDGEQKFKCPCHGSGFYITGINFEGPAPRPLERYAIRIAEDGMLEVDKSQKFQQEMGQWDDSKSYVEMA